MSLETGPEILQKTWHATGSYLSLGDVLNEIRSQSGLLFHLGGDIIHARSGCHHGSDLVHSLVFDGEVLVKILPMTPCIPLQKFDALHIHEDLYGIGHGSHVGWRYLNHSQPGTSLHQIKKVYVAGSESHVDHLLIWIEILNLTPCANYPQSHIFHQLHY